MKKIVIETIIVIFIILLSLLLFFGPKQIEILGNNYLSNIKVLDLSNVTIDNMNWINKLNEFSNLEEVILGENAILKEDKDSLEEKYPGIKFKGVSIINLYDLKVRDDITTLDLSKTKVDNNITKYLELFPNLQEVTFGNQLLDKDLELLLIKIYPDTDFTFDVKVLDKVVANKIETLDLSKSNINNKEDLVKSLKLLNNLKHLEMSNTNLSNEELGKLREEFPNIEIDWTIYFGVWHIHTSDIAFSVLISNFPYKRLTSEDLSFLKYCTKLEALDLGHQRITDLNVIVDNLPNLRILILADNKISDLTPLKKLKHLHYLELFINNVKDISPLASLDELVDLNLCFNRIGNYDALLNLPKLERLWLVGTGISYDKYQELKAEYPNAIINKNGPGSTGSGWRSHARYYSMIDMFHKRNYMSEEFSKYD